MCYNIPMSQEEIAGMPVQSETLPIDIVAGVNTEGGVESGMEGLQETSRKEISEQTDPALLDSIFEAVNAPKLTQEQQQLLYEHSEVEGMGLSEWADRRRQQEQIATPVNEEIEIGEQEPTVEDDQIEQGPTQEEIEQRVEVERQRLIKAKIEELANIFLGYSDEDIDSIAATGVPVSGERIIIAGSEREPSFVKTIFEALRDSKNLLALAEQIYGDLEQEARENVMREIAKEQIEQDDLPANTEAVDEEPIEETLGAEAEPDVVNKDVAQVTQSNNAITPDTSV